MSMSRVRSRFFANVGVLNVAFSPFITITKQKAKKLTFLGIILVPKVSGRDKVKITSSNKTLRMQKTTVPKREEKVFCVRRFFFFFSTYIISVHKSLSNMYIAKKMRNAISVSFKHPDVAVLPRNKVFSSDQLSFSGENLEDEFCFSLLGKKMFFSIKQKKFHTGCFKEILQI